ncbi:MAG: PD-(D/E)XK nuclease family protein [Oscillospiraceae bacterium]|nr:PD-(D/E)XK nuclease family protein [Oscillospiraceae bacterium]
MFQFILGSCGTGKSTVLMHRMKQDLQNHKKIFLLVPEQFSFEAEKKLYAFLGAELFNQCHVYSFATLSHAILQTCGVSRNDYASEQGKLLFLWQAVQQCQQQQKLQIFGRQNQAEFLLQIQTMITKIRKAGVRSEQLWQTAPMFSGRLGQKLQDISRILDAYDRILEQHELCDSLTDLTESAAVAATCDFFQETEIYMDEFDSFTGDQYQMLEVIAEQAENFTIAIRSDAMKSIPSGVFVGGNQTFQKLRKLAPDQDSVRIQVCREYYRSANQDLKMIAEKTANPNHNYVNYANPANLHDLHVHIFQAYDPAGETEYICATICKLLAENTALSCRDIAIAVRQTDVYMPLLERALTRYHLPYDIAVRKSILHTELIAYFLNLLELLSSPSWSTDTILRCLKNEFSGYDPELVSMLEHFCFTYSIDKQDWSKSFCEQSKDAAENLEQFGGQALEALRLTVIQLLQELRNQCRGADVRTICMMLYQHLCRKNQAYQEIYQKQETVQQHEFIAVWNILSETFDTVVELFGEDHMKPDQLSAIFRMLLQNSSFAIPPQTLDSIRIVDAQTARLNMPRIVFAPGVSDGVYPSHIQENSIFQQHELELLEQQKITIARRLPELYSDELLIIHKIFSACSEQLYLTYPEINADYENAPASVMIEEILRLFPENSEILQKQENLSLLYYAWTMESTYFHFVQNLNRQERQAEIASLRAVLEQNPVYAARIEKLCRQQVQELSGLSDMQISPEIMQNLIGSCLHLSASGIEKFYRCPFQYFCLYCLKLYAPEKITLTAQNIGNFAHRCLEEILKKYDIKTFSELSVQELEKEISLLSETFSKENFSDAVRRDGRFQLNYRMNSKSILQLLQYMQEEIRNNPEKHFIPISTEKTLPPFSVCDGKALCHGKIDRVDICEIDQEKLLRVIDYKTSEKHFRPERLAEGLDLQMLIYLFALEETQEYGKIHPTAVLYMPSGQPKEINYLKREDAKSAGKEILNAYYRMKGIVLEQALAYTEPELAAVQTSVMESNKNQVFSVNMKQMQNLRKHVYQKISEMTEKVYAGAFPPEPNVYIYESEPEITPCKYCPCADLCGKAVKETIKHTKTENQQALATVFGAPEVDPDADPEQKEIKKQGETA